MKLKIVVSMERIFEPMAEFYEDNTAEGILKAEIAVYEDDPSMLLDHRDTTLSVKGEILEP
jgi:hypothetical protein